MDTSIKSTTAINPIRESARAMKASPLQRQIFQLLFTCLLMVTVVTVTATAQGTGGPTIFNQDETMIPNAVRYAVMFLFGIAFLFGAGSVVWGVMCYTRR